MGCWLRIDVLRVVGIRCGFTVHALVVTVSSRLLATRLGVWVHVGLRVAVWPREIGSTVIVVVLGTRWVLGSGA